MVDDVDVIGGGLSEAAWSSFGATGASFTDGR